ncbi:SDR family NAD(P)-dependent oxidoreductase [Exiguobacterium aestuarii]|uniref:SDR family NAD(P)-dependent oxidoreductase n=2 Tax=Exiguobacterium TaxID=33986 RepID=A0ABW2PT73_9BACL|nr:MULTISPECIES: SDR family NAD(P)-dependent oxidoreductase [Exiguobacterium]MCT4787501.1 SDR family NAD(P)-dependent oxidoreductase [Exiguobacterium aestuarii]
MKILVTGATDGIGLATSKLLIEEGHEVLVHGRDEQKLAAVV